VSHNRLTHGDRGGLTRALVIADADAGKAQRGTS